MLSNDFPQVASQRAPQNSLLSFVWPFLRLAELSLRWPRFTLSLFCSLTLVMAAGLQWVSTDDSLENFLKSPTPDYQVFERMRDRFPSSDLDVFVTIEAREIFTSQNLQQMQDLKFALLLAEPVRSVVSIFSLKEPLQANALPASIIPDEIPDDPAELKRLAERLYQHPFARDRLLSKPDKAGQLVLFIVALDADHVRERGLPAVIQTLKSEIGDALGANRLKVGVSGVPTMKAEVIEGTARDVVLFNAVGLLVGGAICWLFFRRPQLVLMANIPAIVAIVFCLGLFGWTGTRIDPLMNAVMPLVIVVTLNNAMHFLFAICRELDAGIGENKAIQNAIHEIGPACALTSITTSIALLSLLFSTSPLIRSFGAMAGVSVLIALTLIVVIMPMLAKLFLRSNRSYLVGGSPYNGVRLLDRAAIFIGKAVSLRPDRIAATGVLLTGLFLLAYTQLEPRYQLSDMLPDQGQSAAVTERMAYRLGGVFPLNVMIEWPERLDVTASKVSIVLAEVHKALATHPTISKVSSWRDLQAWAELGGVGPDEATARLLETVPLAIKSRFVDEETRAALVSGYINDLEAKQVLGISREIEAKLSNLRSLYPEFRLSLTGLSSIAAKRSTDVISQLSISMMGAVAIVILLIGLAFRSMLMAALSIVPNLFALFATGTWLLFTSGGLDYATVVGLTVAFGLAVDDTIHVLNRYQLEKREHVSTAEAMDKTLRLIGTVLILTTVVLLAGLSVTQLSVVPPTRQFGAICMLTLFFALIADLVILPALILVTARGANASPSLANLQRIHPLNRKDENKRTK